MTVNVKIVARSLSLMAFGVAVLIAPSLLWAFYYREFRCVPALLAAMGVAAGIGGLLRWLARNARSQFHQREALATVALSWIMFGCLGALPFIFAGVASPARGLFESFSGVTTTGASILDDIESVPKCILFWRSFTHWVGGIGVVMLSITLLPYLGAGGKMLARAESASHVSHAFRPRARKHALVLLMIYTLLTGAETFALLLTGRMDLFEALCHTFGTVATGGFSTRQASIAAFDSIAVELIVVFFMICGATSFTLYYQFMGRDWTCFFKSSEWRVLVALILAVTALVTLNIGGILGAAPVGGAPTVDNGLSVSQALRPALFTVTSLGTNTGFVTQDYDAWPFFSRMVLVVMMFIGGSAGSTSGGLKVFRVVIIAKLILHRIDRTFRPYVVRAVHMDGYAIDPSTQHAVLIFALAYMVCFTVCSLTMSLFGLPFESAVSAVAACMSNTGPGLQLVGGAESYSLISDGGLVFLCFTMLLGRLELFTLLVLLLPRFWVTQ